MRSIDVKVIRELLHLKGQVIAIALVIACGVGVYVGMRGTREERKAGEPKNRRSEEPINRGTEEPSNRSTDQPIKSQGESVRSHAFLLIGETD